MGIETVLDVLFLQMTALRGGCMLRGRGQVWLGNGSVRGSVKHQFLWRGTGTSQVRCLNRLLVPRIAVTVGQRSPSAIIFIVYCIRACMELGVILGSAGRMLRLEHPSGRGGGSSLRSPSDRLDGWSRECVCRAARPHDLGQRVGSDSSIRSQ